MAKVVKPQKDSWDKIEKTENSPIELIKTGSEKGIVRAKSLKIKSKSKTKKVEGYLKELKY